MRDIEEDRDEDDDPWAEEDGWPDDEDDEADLVPCPSCGAEVYEDAEWCPSCEQYITRSRSPWADRPWWWIVLGLAGIAAVIRLSMP